MNTQIIAEDTLNLPVGVSVSINTVGNSQHVTIHSQLHVTKEFTLPHCYATSYSWQMILNDRDFLKYLSRYR